MGRTWMLAVLVGGMGVMGGVGSAAAQTWERGDEGWCERDEGRGDQERSCMVLSADLADVGHLTVDGGMNGGVRVQGWSGSEVRVQARVWANARSESRAEEMADAVRIHAADGTLRAEGPQSGRRESWGVSWIVSVPFDTDLELETHNGGITINAVNGRIRFAAVNGGVHLEDLGGDVEGRTRNGGLHVELAGDRWDGAGLDVETVNGGVTVYLPRDYSAQLETGTVNGGMDIDFPVTVRGRIGRSLSVALGGGGPTVRAVTTNGGVRIAHRGSSRSP